jgi:hypothetical protein
LSGVVPVHKDGLIDLCKDLSTNKDAAVTNINFENTNLGDQGITLLSTWIGSLSHGLASINIANCGVKGKVCFIFFSFFLSGF